MYSVKIFNELFQAQVLLSIQLCFRRFPIDGFSGKW